MRITVKVHRRPGWAALVALLLMIGAPATATANGLPAVWSRAPGGAVQIWQPDPETRIAVLREQLWIDLRANDGRGPAHIRAVYHLQNGSPDPATVTVAFPAPLRYSDGVAGAVPAEPLPKVTLDGQPVEVFRAEEPIDLEGADLTVPANWLNPYTGRSYSLGSAWKPEQPTFVRFQISLPDGREHDLAVEYSQEASWDRRHFIRRVLRYDYLLLPARHWAGFGELFIEVLAPTGRLVRANVPLPRAGTLSMEGGKPVDTPVYQAHLTGLPTDNLSIFLAPAGGGPSFIWAWWWGRPERAWLLAVLALLGGLAAGWLQRDRSRKWRGAVGTMLLVLTLATVSLFTRENIFDPNPIGNLATRFFFLPFTWVLAFAGWARARRVGGRNISG